MLRAVLRKGVIIPIEPVPTDWQEGAALEVDRADAQHCDIDAWAAAMNQLCADSSTEDEAIMRRAIEEQRQQAKAHVPIFTPVQPALFAPDRC